MKVVHNIRWVPLPSSWFKLNTDSLVQGNPKAAGAGEDLRNEAGAWIKGFSTYLGTTSSLVAEQWAIKIGLVIARDKGIHSLNLEFDGVVALHLLDGSNSENLALSPLVSECRALIQEFPHFREKHI